MQKYLPQIKRIKQKFIALQEENFEAASSGTHHKVFLSDNYAIRYRDDNPMLLLLREANFLKQLDYALIPKILWFGKINNSFFMVENRLPGQTINLVWKNLSINNKKNIVKQIVKFLQHQRSKTKDFIHSVKTGKKYDNFLDYLMDGIKRKTANIKIFKQTSKILQDLLLVINDPKARDLFTVKTKNALVHGDLIIHNLLTDGKNLTGVLDWELALWGDPDYDLFRLFYYQECAKAYQEQGADETFEADYMDKLIAAILKSDLIKNKSIFWKKYQLVRAVFYLNALYWAISSNSPEKNINELIMLWNKKSGVKHWCA